MKILSEEIQKVKLCNYSIFIVVDSWHIQNIGWTFSVNELKEEITQRKHCIPALPVPARPGLSFDPWTCFACRENFEREYSSNKTSYNFDVPPSFSSSNPQPSQAKRFFKQVSSRANGSTCVIRLVARRSSIYIYWDGAKYFVFG